MEVATTARNRPYVFQTPFGEVHLVEREPGQPQPGKVTGFGRLRACFFLEANQWERERLLRELDLDLAGMGNHDWNDTALFEDRLFKAIERRFVTDEFARPPFAAPVEKPRAFAPITTNSMPAPSPWIGLELLDQDGKPVPGGPYRIVTPDNQTIDGTLGEDGTARIRGLAPGNCRIDCPYVEPRAATTHVAVPGDHASRIAALYGFEDFDAVWSHSSNTDLRANRENPHQLVAGDEVFVPALVPRTVDRPTDEMHTFRMRRSPLKLRLKLVDAADQPIAGTACMLGDLTLVSDADGFVEAPIDKFADSATLTFGGISVALQIGHLAPVGGGTDGLKARLFNMGFVIDPTVNDDDEEMGFALQDFQAKYDLPVTGSLDDATKAKIKDVYGC